MLKPKSEHTNWRQKKNRAYYASDNILNALHVLINLIVIQPYKTSILLLLPFGR